jgi:hypothetical protein
MARILKALGLGLVIATIVWLVTLWQWQNAERDIGMSDIVVQLIVLPLLLTLGLLAALWGCAALAHAGGGACDSAVGRGGRGRHRAVGRSPGAA